MQGRDPSSSVRVPNDQKGNRVRGKVRPGFGDIDRRVKDIYWERLNEEEKFLKKNQKRLGGSKMPWRTPRG